MLGEELLNEQRSGSGERMSHNLRSESIRYLHRNHTTASTLEQYGEGNIYKRKIGL